MAYGIDARRIAYSLADSQLGMLARGQLRERDLSSNLIDYWLSSGHLFKCLPGVYSFGRPADSVEALWMAGVLFGGSGALLAGASAAHAWGMSDRSNRIEIVRSHGVTKAIQGRAPHQDSSFLMRRGSLIAEDVAHVGPVPAMDPARTLIDLSGRATEKQLRRYFIKAGCANLLTPQCLLRIEKRSRGFKGRSQLLALQRIWDPTRGRIRSVLEGEFKLLCAEEVLPPPMMNQRVGGYEVDALWEKAKLIVELDGRQFHGDAVSLAVDSEKTRHLRGLGYRVLRFTWYDVTHRPEWVANQIRKGLGSIYPGIAGVN